MQLFPPVALLLFGGWILVAVYVVINFAIPALAPGALKRLLTNPFPDKSLSARIRGGIEMVTWFGTLALVLIYPLQTQSNVFGAGLILYCVGMVFTAISLWNYTFTPPDTPVTAGVYRFSRNPIYVGYTIVGYGMALLVGSWTILILHTIEVIVMHWTVLNEERFCLDRYGDSYREFMKRVPRYLFI